jgi:Domain of unknown function (DUF222)
MFVHLSRQGAAAASDDQLIAAVRSFVRARRLLDASEAHALSELATRETCDRAFGLRTSSWLARESGMSVGAARGRVAAANRLTTLDTIDQALSRGEISWDRVKAICDATNDRNTEAMAAIQDALLELSHGTTFRRFQRDVDELGRLTDPDGAEPKTETDSRLQLRDLGDGVQLAGRFFGEHAEWVRQGIASVTDQLFRRHQRDREQFPELGIAPRTQLQAEALAQLCAGSAAPEVRLVVPADRPGDGSLECDPTIRAVTAHDDGEPLAVGRRHRLFTPAIRTALDVRDGGCVFPGCDARPEHCDAHHIRHWRHGGETSLVNACLLCRHHHGVVHRRGWVLTSDFITSPQHQTLALQRHGRARAPNRGAA